MNSPQNNFFYSLCFVFLFFSCGGGGNSIIGVYDTGEIIGEWLFSPNCEEYILGSDTIYLENELPDTISIFSNSDNVLSIDAGNNVLDANIDISGDFYIRYQSFKAFLEIGNISDTATIYLTGDGNFSSSSDGTMDLTFSEPNLPGQIECSILLTKLD
ncbi:hypothetical protein OAR04_00425 [Flavobacteriales bacterium]|nr:hypothetical protein [Flavobacteriales bacterium]